MDLTILSSRIFTGDASRPWAEAICIRDNRILAVGTNDEVKRVSPSNAQILELPGRLITPGFRDAHTHFITLGLTLRWVDLRDLTSLEACRQRIRQAVASRRPGEWIIGRGWNQHLWQERREPRRQDLDALTPNNPAMMIRACGHSLWVNSRALEKSGITRDTNDPPGGKIDRDPNDGEPTGLLREARHLIQPHIPPFTREELKKAALDAQHAMLRVGITGIRSMEALEQLETLAELDREAKLKLRIYHLLPYRELEEAASRGITPGWGSDRLWFGQAKLFADGSLGSETALLHEPYLHKPGDYGLAYLTPGELREHIALAYRYGCDVAIHAIGDKAVSNALEAIMAVRKTSPQNHKRDSLEHVQLIRPADFSLFRELGVTSSMQPAFIVTDWEVAMEKWGPERCRYGYALKAFLQHGIPLPLSSDTPVESCNALQGLQAAVTRQTPDGQPQGGWFPEHRLSLKEALTGYTAPYAWVTHKEKELGALTPGKWADLTIFTQDLGKLSPHEWLTTEVEMTMINGEIVYQKA